VVWVIGIGLAAIFSAILLASPRTQHWSELRIAATSMGASISLVAAVLYLIGG
jgi:hypothetical protein